MFVELKDGKGKNIIELDKYDYHLLRYEGEYINGERNGKGKEYYSKNKIKFEGEYLNGKKWNGNGYDKKGNIIFKIKNGRKEKINKFK